MKQFEINLEQCYNRKKTIIIYGKDSQDAILNAYMAFDRIEKINYCKPVEA